MKTNQHFYMVFLFSIFVSFSVEAEDFTFSVENHIGIISGLSQEYVYEGDKQISRLEWEEKYVPFTTIAVCFAWNGLSITGTVSSAIPLKSGVMRNYDYLLSQSSELTNFSEHDVFLERHGSYDIGAGYELDIEKWKLGIAAGFLYLNRKSTASNGYFQYASAGKPLTGDEPIGEFTGAVITYNQKISYFHADLFAGYRVFNTLIGLQFDFYPYIWIENIDHHIVRSTEFYDTIPGAMGGQLGLMVKYKPSQSKNIELIAGCTFEKIFEKKGSTAQRTTGTDTLPEFSHTNNHQSAYSGEFWYIFMGVNYTLPL